MPRGDLRCVGADGLCPPSAQQWSWVHRLVLSGCHALRTVQHSLPSALSGGPTAIKAAQRLSCVYAHRRGRVRCACRLAGSLGNGWQACTHGHTAAGTDTRTHARLRIQTETRRHTRARMKHERTSACTQTHKCMHTNIQARAHIRKLQGTPRRHQRAAGKDRRRPRAVCTRGSAADFGSRWFACRLLLGDALALDVARNRSGRTRMWRVKRPARVLAHVCATARTIDGSARARQRYGVAPVGGAVRVRCAGYSASDIRRQSIRAKSRRSSLVACERLRLAVLEWRADASHAPTRTCDPLRSVSDGISADDLSDAGHDEHPSRDPVRVTIPRLHARECECGARASTPRLE